MKGYMSMCLVDSRSECNGDLIHFPGKLIRTPAVCTAPPLPLPPPPTPTPLAGQPVAKPSLHEYFTILIFK